LMTLAGNCENKYSSCGQRFLNEVKGYLTVYNVNYCSYGQDLNVCYNLCANRRSCGEKIAGRLVSELAWFSTHKSSCESICNLPSNWKDSTENQLCRDFNCYFPCFVNKMASSAPRNTLNPSDYDFKDPICGAIKALRVLAVNDPEVKKPFPSDCWSFIQTRLC